ncbi:Cytochrome P450 4A7, partial [Trametes pubescens]
MPAGHTLTFKDVLHEVLHRLFLSIIFPQWVLRLGTAKMRYFEIAYGELGPAISIPKSNADDTVFTHTNTAGEKRSLPIPRGTYITICTSGMYNNPRYWEDPEVFKPERFLGNYYPRDAFLPFSGGPRGCIGCGNRGGRSANSVRVQVQGRGARGARFAGETFMQRKARLLKSQHNLTTGI